MNQDKELLNLEKRFAELSRTAYQRDIITYTDFLANKLIALVEYQKKERTQ